jgi:hypothetical protein
MIASQTKIEYHDGLFFVYDGSINQSLFIFDKNGKFLSKLKSDDKNHTSKLTTFCLDRTNRQIIIGDGFRAINYYDYNLNYIKKESLMLFYKDFEMMPDGNMAICAAKLNNYEDGTWLNGHKPKPVGYGLWYRDRNEKLCKDFPFSVKIFPNGSEYTEIPKNFSNYKDLLYYNCALNDTIFTLDKNEAKSKYVVDFGKKSVKENLQLKSGKWLFEYFSKDPDRAFMAQNFWETDKVIKFDYFMGIEMHTMLLYKANNIMMYGKLVNDLYGFPILLKQVLDNGHVLAIVQPSMIFDVLKAEGNEKKNWFNNLKKLARTVKADDNCILVDIKLK